MPCARLSSRNTKLNAARHVNPFQWSREHQISLVLALAVGFFVGHVFGYLVYGIARDAAGGVPFAYWAGRPLRYSGLWWGLAGAIVGAALI
ncbi:hypothetical protein BH23BAC4_BH23BAC4_01940 [soil metagenome]